MKNPRILRISHREYIDFYADIAPTLSALCALFSLFPDANVFVKIYFSEFARNTLERMKKYEKQAITCYYDEREDSCIMICHRDVFLRSVQYFSNEEVDELLVANIKDGIAYSEKSVCFNRFLNSLVKNALSDISVSVIYNESELEVSTIKGKWPPRVVQNTIERACMLDVP